WVGRGPVLTIVINTHRGLQIVYIDLGHIYIQHKVDVFKTPIGTALLSHFTPRNAPRKYAVSMWNVVSMQGLVITDTIMVEPFMMPHCLAQVGRADLGLPGEGRA
ncbi:hypothetical protein HAX54_039297, partial [Datura stramonium]|nr:hypothetical protein [Datura stramonium]